MKRTVFLPAFWLFHLLLGSGSSQSTTNSVSGLTTAKPPEVTTPGISTAVISPGSGGTGTAATPDVTSTAVTASNVTSTSPTSAGVKGNPKGQLRPWEVALIALASAAMAVILTLGLAVTLRNCSCLRNLTRDRYRGHHRSAATGHTLAVLEGP